MAAGCPTSPAGVPRMYADPGNSRAGSQSGVRMTPGEMALTRIPRGPNSAAQARVSVSSAPLVELYSAPCGMPSRAIHEPRLMMTPPPALTISGAIAWVRKNGAFTFTVYTRSKVSSSVVSVLPGG
ncbi:MAG: hypothetical protein JWM19_7505 [Actinomycetia bacterium]|nr:hypothetical protein [Actinomycetes bacterium]